MSDMNGFVREVEPTVVTLDNKVSTYGFEEKVEGIEDERRYPKQNKVYLNFESAQTGPYQSVGELFDGFPPVAIRNTETDSDFLNEYCFYILGEDGEPVHEEGFGPIKFREDGIGYTYSKESGSEYLIGGRDVEGPLQHVKKARLAEDGFVVESVEEDDSDADLAYMVIPEKERDHQAEMLESPQDVLTGGNVEEQYQVTGLNRVTLPVSEHVYQKLLGRNDFEKL